MPDYLREGLSERLRVQEDDVVLMEAMRRALIKQYGGFGIPDDLAYQLNDAQDPEMPDEHRQKTLKAVRQASQKIVQGNHRGREETQSLADARRETALARHAEMIEARQAGGQRDLSIARRLAELEKVSVSTAQRWLRKK